MNVPVMFMPVGQDRAVAKLAAAILVDGASASVVGPDGAGKTAVLDRLASELASGEARVLRVACPSVGGLSLPAFLSQVIGRTSQGVLSDGELELASDVLTQADASCSLIALLVDDAHHLLPPALRYIQFACRSGPQLRVVLAGRPGTSELLRGDEFGYLRQRISRNIQLPLLSATTEQVPEPFPDVSIARLPAASPPARRRNGSAWALAGIGIAASVAVGWLDWQNDPPVSSAASVMPSRFAAPTDMPSGVALAEALPVASEPVLPEATVPVPLPEAPRPILAEAEPVTPREAAGSAFQALLDTRAVATKATQAIPERLSADAVPLPEEPVTVNEAIPADAVATPRETAVLQSQPSPEPPATVFELPVASAVPEWKSAGIPPAPEPSVASAAATVASPEPEPAVADATPEAEPSVPERAMADAASAHEPSEANAVPAAELPTVATGPAGPLAPEPAVADAATAPLQPEVPAPVMASLPEPSAPPGNLPAEADPEPAVANLPTPPIPVPAPALAVVAMPEAPRRVARPARIGPERVLAYDARADERRCRDIVLRAQLGEDITNADRQFLRAGCRAGR